ncbi:MAG: methyltransferase domain-containing protein [Chitinophagaceae bacterium]|nr:MAG: methyltransferase domain-containing protein [Chitinophagaceae bacterium]
MLKDYSMKSNIYDFLKKSPLLTKIAREIKRVLFRSSASYWENRYRKSGNSGRGSYGKYAVYKANVINDFVKKKYISEVIEFGCGDGNQIKSLEVLQYTGLDVSPSAIKICKDLFWNDPSKKFILYQEFLQQQQLETERFDLSLSLDVIYHLVEDEVYEKYMNALFAAAAKYVIIYAWDTNSENKIHVLHRKFSDWVSANASEFVLSDHIPGGTEFCDFYIYQRTTVQEL